LDRQKIRKGIILCTFFLFPVVFYYLSPVLIIQASMAGIVNGSFIVFGLLLVSALFFGRAYCGWVCPAAGCQEAIFLSRDKRVSKGNWIKWAIWIPWLGTIVTIAVLRGGYQTMDFFYMTRMGFSVSDVPSVIAYLIVLFLLIVLPAFAIGRRSFCHHLCWMAPFMIVGRWAGNNLRTPALRLEAQSENCEHCQTCTRNCPMSLSVEEMVRKQKMETAECILCGTCIDSCEFDVIRYRFSIP
jgi:polyferredoxin